MTAINMGTHKDRRERQEGTLVTVQIAPDSSLQRKYLALLYRSGWHSPSDLDLWGVGEAIPG